jgi:hypothetical protein
MPPYIVIILLHPPRTPTPNPKVFGASLLLLPLPCSKQQEEAVVQE